VYNVFEGLNGGISFNPKAMYHLIDKYGVRESTEDVNLFSYWKWMCDEGIKVYNPQSHLKAVDGSKATHEVYWGTGERAESIKRSYVRHKKEFV